MRQDRGQNHFLLGKAIGAARLLKILPSKKCLYQVRYLIELVRRVYRASNEHKNLKYVLAVLDV